MMDRNRLALRVKTYGGTGWISFVCIRTCGCVFIVMEVFTLGSFSTYLSPFWFDLPVLYNNSTLFPLSHVWASATWLLSVQRSLHDNIVSFLLNIQLTIDQAT